MRCEEADIRSRTDNLSNVANCMTFRLLASSQGIPKDPVDLVSSKIRRSSSEPEN